MRDGELEMLEPEGGKPGRRKKEVRDQRKQGEERRGEEGTSVEGR